MREGGKDEGEVERRREGIGKRRASGRGGTEEVGTWNFRKK